MAVSNKKRKTILRAYPAKSVSEIANQLGLSKRDVKRVLGSAGRLPRPSIKISRTAVVAIIVLVVVSISAYRLMLGPGPAKLSRLSGEMNVLVVTIDTLRADRLGCYGYRPANTPVVDSVAESGVRFENAYSHQPITLPSHATIFTGTHPAYHGIEDNGLFVLPDEAVTLAEVMQGEGISTGAVIASFVLHRQFGLDQGFATYDDSLSAGRKQDPAGFDEMTATAVSDRALAWIAQNAGERWFLWIHYYDPHSAYEPPPAYLRGGAHPYDGEVAYVDDELGRVLEDLARRGLNERTLVIITSDHGESIGEHGELTHGLFLYDATMRVPLIVSLPGALPGRRVVSQPVSLMDIAPTVLSALGIAPPKSFQGRSLVPLFFSGSPDQEETPLILETMFPWHEHGWSPSSAIVSDNFKYIRAPRPELYDLVADPHELENLYDNNRGRGDVLDKRLSDLRNHYSQFSLEDRAAAKMDDQSRDRLARLGYIFSGAAPVQPLETAPDVKDMIELEKDVEKALELHTSGQQDEAISVLEHLLEKSPDSRRLLNRLGTWYAEKRDFQHAETYFKRLLRLDPEYVEGYINLGLVYANTSRREQAALMAQTALSKLPRSAKAHGLLGILRLQEKDYVSALEYFDKAIEIYPSYHQALANRGTAHYFLGDYQKAHEDVKRAAQIMPGQYSQFLEKLEKEMKAQ